MELIIRDILRSIELYRCKCGIKSIIVGIEYLPYLEKKKENSFLIRAYIYDVHERKTFIRVVQTRFTEELILSLFKNDDEMLTGLMYSLRLRLPKPIKSWDIMNEMIEKIFQTGCVKEIRDIAFTSAKKSLLDDDLTVIEKPTNENKIILGCIIMTPIQEYYDLVTLTSPIDPHKIRDDEYLFSEVLKFEYNRRWKERQLWDLQKAKN